VVAGGRAGVTSELDGLAVPRAGDEAAAVFGIRAPENLREGGDEVGVFEDLEAEFTGEVEEWGG
jgi:hypothetical protein